MSDLVRQDATTLIALGGGSTHRGVHVRNELGGTRDRVVVWVHPGEGRRGNAKSNHESGHLAKVWVDRECDPR